MDAFKGWEYGGRARWNHKGVIRFSTGLAGGGVFDFDLFFFAIDPADIMTQSYVNIKVVFEAFRWGDDQVFFFLYYIACTNMSARL